MYRLLLSFRFFRMRKINLLSVVCIALGVMVLIIVYSVLEGFQTRLKDSFKSTIPHVLVESIRKDDRDRYLEVLRNVGGVTGVAPRVETVGLIGWKTPSGRPNTIASAAGQKGIYVVAIDPAAEETVTQFKTMLTNVAPPETDANGYTPPDLRVPNPDDPFHISDEIRRGRSPYTKGIIVGEELAKHLKLERGADVTIFSVRLNPNAKEGQQLTPSNRTFYLAGVFKSGMYEQNLFTVYIPLEEGRNLMERAGYATEKIAIGTRDFEAAGEVKVRVETALKEAGFYYGERVTTWQDRNRPLLSALVVEKRVLTILMFFLVLMACGTILAILYMMVLEKRREIGILKALGAPTGGLMQLFLINGGVIGFLGATLGLGLGLLFLRYINWIEEKLSDWCGIKVFSKEVYVFDSLPVVYDWQAIALMTVATVVFSFVAAFVPAYIAARSDAVKSIRNE